MVNLKNITPKDKDAWNTLVTHPVQTWEWGEFRQKAGVKVLRLGIFRNKKLNTALLLTIHKIPFSPYKIGVLFKGPKPTKQLLEALKKVGKEENLLFIRMEPNVIVATQQNKLITDNWKLETLLRSNGAVPGKTSFTKQTFVVDLAKPEGELLANMHHKTRYNIRLAGRRGVKIQEDNSEKAFEKYLALLAETVKRQSFYAHTEHYHRLMWQTLKMENGKWKMENSNRLTAHLLTANYKGETLIAWILFAFKDSLYYPYGASSDKYREVMASHAAMWEAIKFGKKMGLKKFDLWGKEEGKGFTRFKEGFNPQIIEFLGTWDLPINKTLYILFRIAEKVRWLILKFPLSLSKPQFK